MSNHEYILLSDIPEYVLKVANFCINREYRICNKCGFQMLNLLEEIIGSPGGRFQKIYMNYYFINNKLISEEDFEGLTCEEIMVKMLIE